jgi:STE24 endopeptidase
MSEMTATRIGRGATLLVGVVVWLVAAALLWRTSVPGNLNPPHLRVGDFFTPAQTHRAEHFSSVITWVVVAATIVQVAVLAVVARYGRRLANAFPVGRIGRGTLVAAAAATFTAAAVLPFEVVLTWWERRYGLVSTSYWEVIAGSPAALGGEVAVLTIVIVIFMALAAALPRTWWIAAAAALTAIVAGVAMLQPLLQTGTHPVRDTDPEIAAGIQRLERVEHVQGTKVDVQKVSDETSAINAFTYGLGPTERVVLWDTLFDGRLSPPQILVIAAHELGHVRSRHIQKAIGWSFLTALLELGIVAVVTRRRGGLAQPAVVPLALLVLTVASLAGSPAYNEVSRRYEAEADWRALNATREPKAAIGLFEKFTASDLAEPSPATWEYLFFEDHPTVMQRIAMVRAWQARNKR